MTNRIIKKSHFAKSKILLIILCILGLVFSYSCNCRNNSTAPVDDGNPPPPPPKTFTASLSESKSSKKLVVKTSGDTNTQITLVFSSDNNIDTIKPTAVSVNDYNLEVANFEYNKDNGELNIVGNGLESIKPLKDEADGTTKNVTLTFTLTTKDDVDNISTTVDVDLSLIKSTVFKTTDGGQFQEAIKGLGSYDYTGITFNFATGATFNKTEITVNNSKSRGDEDKDSVGNITQFGTDFASDLTSPQYNSKWYFKEVTFEHDKSNPPASGTVATLHFSYVISSLFETENGGSTGSITIKADVNRSGHTSKWEK